MHLTADELARYRHDGFAGPFRGWSEDAIAAITDRLLRRLRQLGLIDDEWLRLNRHGEIAEIAELVTNAELGDRLASILGPDLLLFETHVGIITPERPGAGWHRHDYPDWTPQPSTHCVARIALTAEPAGHCHLFVPPHATPADAADTSAPDRLITGQTATAVPLRPGEFALFDGSLLHCAAERDSGRASIARTTLVVRVATPAQRLGAFAETGQCCLLRGRDECALNRCTPLAIR